ncbi:DASH family cryptochrome [Aestuariibacter salexigens]|uniref:DASH family cryptochrome n=1 Tax=Aestuariibacter salexigens TaxID=226010 RepID=UPI00047E16D2|nr:DASH family cryptochrome [Aestuariibacter salexigens]
MKKSHTLHWFRHDLRVHDNPALLRAAKQANTLSCVFVIDPSWYDNTAYDASHLGKHREQFLFQSLAALNNTLKQLGQRLVILKGDSVEVLKAFAIEHNVDFITCSRHPGVVETQHLQALRNALPNVDVEEAESFTLFNQCNLPFSLSDMPDTFSPFRHKVEKFCTPASPVQTPDALPPPLKVAVQEEQSLPTHSVCSDWHGGEPAALKQLHHYLFDTDHIASYKETRNGLTGWDYSSKFSAWLANGSLSCRYVYQHLKRYEEERVANESTYWLYFELLWREFFQCQLLKYGHRLFSFAGIKQHKPRTSHDKTLHTLWCQGKTQSALVNAAMNQLNATGYMSNRARQWVASYYVNTLQQDWRYAAAYFEQQLIDFDVAANWGNWQYLAGVGSDPRGLREFNLAKQAQMYDPEGDFVRAWG